jgi:hypothetical protein
MLIGGIPGLVSAAGLPAPVSRSDRVLTVPSPTPAIVQVPTPAPDQPFLPQPEPEQSQTFAPTVAPSTVSDPLMNAQLNELRQSILQVDPLRPSIPEENEKTPQLVPDPDDNNPRIYMESHSWPWFQTNRDPLPFYHDPLYFEEPNLERCGKNHGVFQPLVSAGHFYGRIPLLPVMLVTQRPCEKVYSLKDCRSCQEFDKHTFMYSFFTRERIVPNCPDTYRYPAP